MHVTPDEFGIKGSGIYDVFYLIKAMSKYASTISYGMMEIPVKICSPVGV